jgi:hypothetical protein
MTYTTHAPDELHETDATGSGSRVPAALGPLHRAVLALLADRRGVSELLGLMLAFGIVVALVALLQVAVVPVWDATEEYDHSLRVHEDVVALDESVSRVAASGVGERPTVETGVVMPSAGPLLRSPPAQGDLRTVAVADVVLSNATAVDPAAARFWDGSTRTYPTVAYEYEAPYSHYGSAPRLVSEPGTLYAHHANGAGIADDYFGVERFVLVNGDRVTVVTLEGAYDSDGATVSAVELVPTSAGGEAVVVENATGGPLTVTVPSRMDHHTWRELLADQLTTAGGRVVSVSCDVEAPGEPCGRAHVVLADGRYELSMARVGLDSQYRVRPPAYVVDREGNESVVPANGTGVVTVEVRDAYNNPVSGVELRAENVALAGVAASDASVRASNGAGVTNHTVSDAVVATDEDGRARFVFRAPPLTQLSGPTTATFEVVVDDPSTMDPAAPAAAGRLPVTIYVQGTGFPSVASDVVDVGDVGGDDADRSPAVTVTDDFRALVQLAALEDSAPIDSTGVRYSPITAAIVATYPNGTRIEWTPWPDADPFDALDADALVENVNAPGHPERYADDPAVWSFLTPALPAGSSVALELTAYRADYAPTGEQVEIRGTTYDEYAPTAITGVAYAVDTTDPNEQNVFLLVDGDEVPGLGTASAHQYETDEILAGRLDGTGHLATSGDEVVALFELSDPVADRGTAYTTSGNPDYNDAVAIVRLLGV